MNKSYPIGTYMFNTGYHVFRLYLWALSYPGNQGYFVQNYSQVVGCMYIVQCTTVHSAVDMDTQRS